MVSVVSNVFGGISIAAWILSQLPQLTKNYREGSSEGLSTGFIAFWFGAGVLDLLGCLLTSAIPAQTGLAVTWVLVTAALAAQHLWYTGLRDTVKHGMSHLGTADAHSSPEDTRSRLASDLEEQLLADAAGTEPRHSRASGTSDEYERLFAGVGGVPVGSPVGGVLVKLSDPHWAADAADDLAAKHAADVLRQRGSAGAGVGASAASRVSGGSERPDSEDGGGVATERSGPDADAGEAFGEFPGDPASWVCTAEGPAAARGGRGMAVAVAGCVLLGATAVAVPWLTGAWHVDGRWPMPAGEAFRELTRQRAVLVGWLMGWLMSLFYIGSRVPQIVKNARRGTTKGLSSMMFWLAIAANVTFVLSMLTSGDNSPLATLQRLPWLVDAFVCLTFDLLILAQFLHTRRQVVAYTALAEECRANTG